jgi:group I intron endonuclease
MGYIYLITNKVNSKQYIGQSKCEDIETRWRYHKKMSSQSIGRHLLAAYHKYGIDNFKFQIICITFDDACDQLEEEYIKKFNSLAPNGYNLKPGGKSSKHTDEIKKRISEGLTEEIRNRLREHAKNNLAFRYYKKYTDKEKKVISERQKTYWANLSNEKREEICNQRKSIIKCGILKNGQISEKVRLALQKGSELNKKGVGKYDLQNNLLQIYESISAASRDINISHSTISKVCLGRPSYKTAGGFVWKFV